MYKVSHFFPQATWPANACPHLANIFQILQTFIKDHKNWVNSQCKLQQLENVQQEINELMLFLSMEKSYAYTFWEADYRRIEASIVHFYTFLQLFIKAIIPYPTMTIFECKAANKLCIQISKLEKLMNQILKCVNPIAFFLSDPRFSQQSKIITNFFENWVIFMKRLPNIKRNKLNHIHNLAKFITLTNPIQICTKNIPGEDKIRKKSNTVGANLQLKSYPPSFPFFDSPLSNLSHERLMKKMRKCSSSIQFDNHKEINNVQQISKTKNRIFKIPQKILKHALEEQMKKKAANIDSLTTLQNKIQSLSKNRTLTTNQTNRISRVNVNNLGELFQRKRLKAHSSFMHRSPKSMQKRASNNTISINEKIPGKKRKATFYEQQCQRDSQKMEVRSSKQSTIRKRQLSIHTNSNNNINKKKAIKQQYEVFYHTKLNLGINEGKLHKSKWDIVRNYIKERIQLKKINSILQK